MPCQHAIATCSYCDKPMRKDHLQRHLKTCKWKKIEDEPILYCENRPYVTEKQWELMQFQKPIDEPLQPYPFTDTAHPFPVKVESKMVETKTVVYNHTPKQLRQIQHKKKKLRKEDVQKWKQAICTDAIAANPHLYNNHLPFYGPIDYETHCILSTFE